MIKQNEKTVAVSLIGEDDAFRFFSKQTDEQWISLQVCFVSPTHQKHIVLYPMVLVVVDGAINADHSIPSSYLLCVFFFFVDSGTTTQHTHHTTRKCNERALHTKHTLTTHAISFPFFS